MIRAPAKVNLGLEVLRRREDGYHEICTLFQAVSIYDRIGLRRRRRGIALHCPGVDCDTRENLAWKAADLLLSRRDARGGIEIDIRKGIPAGGGLGGGSSDAAAVLAGGCRLMGLRLSEEELVEAAASLGSDVPFFLRSGAAVGRGRGEVLEHLVDPPPDVAVLVYSPGVPVSTAEVYRRCRPRLTRRVSPLTILLRHWEEGRPEGLGRAVFNDLEDTVLGVHPPLRAARDAIRGSGCTGAQVTGSGSCLFGIYPSRARADRAARQLRRRLPGLVLTARFLPSRRRWGVVKR